MVRTPTSGSSFSGGMKRRAAPSFGRRSSDSRIWESVSLPRPTDSGGKNRKRAVQQVSGRERSPHLDLYLFPFSLPDGLALLCFALLPPASQEEMGGRGRCVEEACRKVSSSPRGDQECAAGVDWLAGVESAVVIVDLGSRGVGSGSSGKAIV